MKMLRVAIVVWLCAVSQSALALDPPPTPTQLREMASVECVQAGKDAGIDYMQALNRAIAKDPRGLVTLFQVPGLDGAAGEANDAILVGLLQRWGDRSFARVLRSQKPAVREGVVAALYNFIGSDMKRLFPRTFALAPPNF